MLLRRATELFLAGYFATCERSPRTIAAYTGDLTQFHQGHPPRKQLESLTPEDLEAWAQRLKSEGLAPASIRRKFAVLKIFLNYWVRKRLLDRSPLWLLRLDFGTSRPLTRTLTPGEMRSLLERARKDLGRLPARPLTRVDERFRALRDLAVLELLFATGMRVGEATALRLPDLRLEERSIVIPGKGRRQRLAFLTEEVSFRVIQSYTATRRSIAADHPHLLLNNALRPLSAQGISAMLRQKASAAGISRHLTPHMIRHTAATFMLQNGADLRIVQEFLGHASVATTQRYTHVTKSHFMSALRRSHPALLVGRRGLDPEKLVG
jgi:site-specific recombinase XerD